MFFLDTERGSETLTRNSDPRQPQRCNVVTANACVGQTSRVVKIFQVLPDALSDVLCFRSLSLLAGLFEPLGNLSVLHWGLVSSRLYRLPARIWAAVYMVAMMHQGSRQPRGTVALLHCLFLLWENSGRPWSNKVCILAMCSRKNIPWAASPRKPWYAVKVFETLIEGGFSQDQVS